jgi:hypothetical protein
MVERMSAAGAMDPSGAQRTEKSGAAIDLRNGLPPSVTVVFAENQSQRNLEYQLTSQDRKQIDAFERGANLASDTDPLQRHRPILPWIF